MLIVHLEGWKAPATGGGSGGESGEHKRNWGMVGDNQIMDVEIYYQGKKRGIEKSIINSREGVVRVGEKCKLSALGV